MKLTLSPLGDAVYDIRVDGATVGTVMGHYYLWTAYLWAVADVMPAEDSEHQIHRTRLRDIRHALETLLETETPWWRRT